VAPPVGPPAVIVPPTTKELEEVPVVSVITPVDAIEPRLAKLRPDDPTPVIGISAIPCTTVAEVHCAYCPFVGVPVLLTLPPPPEYCGMFRVFPEKVAAPEEPVVVRVIGA
jgi:hypothetical protein